MKIRYANIGPDEQIYVAQASAVRAGGLHALRDIADEYLSEPTLQAYPSPLRWLWIALTALLLPVSEIGVQIIAWSMIGTVTLWGFGGSVAAALWATTSPLCLILHRRRLQDVPVAVATLVAVAAAIQHSAVGVGVALLIALSMKEGALLVVPAVAAAWLVSGGGWIPLAGASSLAIWLWAVMLTAIFGSSFPKLIRTAASSHGTAYAKDHQSGAPHRLLVDLFLASPMAFIYAVLGDSHAPALAAAVVALLAAHAFAPVRNVRFVLAADILLRIIGARVMRMPLVELPIAVAIDVLMWRRLRGTYDPVTAALTTALGMTPSQVPVGSSS